MDQSREHQEPLGKRLIRWLLRRPCAEKRVFIVVPDQPPLSDEDYFGACAKIAATAEGKLVIMGLRLNLYEALNRRCPEKDMAKRSEWLKAHEAIVDARRTFLRHFTHPQEFLRGRPKREPIPVMGRDDQE